MSTPEERIKAAREAHRLENAGSEDPDKALDAILAAQTTLDAAADDLFAAVDERDAMRKTLEDYKDSIQILRKAIADIVGSDDADELEKIASVIKISRGPSVQEKELMFRAIEALNKTRE